MSRIIGHRGLAGKAPENTEAGIRLAAEQGLKWIEVDVTLLGDGTPVLFHDRRLNRTTNKKGRVTSLTCSELETIDVGSWFSEQFSGERIPQLGAALKLIKKLGLGLNLELKTNGCSEPRLVEAVLKTVAEVEFPTDRLLVSSFNYRALVHFSDRSDIQVGCLFERLPLNWHKKALRVNAVSIHLHGKRTTKRQISQVKSRGYELYCYTVNSLTFARQLTGYGVDGVFSDFPLLH
ncbi:glycerophosphoryl diester phosphodiesterase [Endozoicomonas sp. SCSIO W0465]|uniref:glycerophosphoryl diester phosphodiesterase n=1 Tax=Endozoicomonas sp. SCSIO W0465 TaxID=2918516 RepID=UPI00207603B3|nr:glycerophosphoryl diester phosphodiesterase [Endozoicomonas sp. SCSIO W0465]USE38243.1 glycerophosphoryl diester phosphodiesterase [Endozoicomonas sp. SCSIO W0465]